LVEEKTPHASGVKGRCRGERVHSLRGKKKGKTIHQCQQGRKKGFSQNIIPEGIHISSLLFFSKCTKKKGEDRGSSAFEREKRGIILFRSSEKSRNFEKKGSGGSLRRTKEREKIERLRKERKLRHPF